VAVFLGVSACSDNGDYVLLVQDLLYEFWLHSPVPDRSVDSSLFADILSLLVLA
jgi:hypothetical protein